MTTQTLRRSDTAPAAKNTAVTLTGRIAGALLALGITAIHLIDQGGLPGTKTPGYMQIMYYFLEVGGVVTAALLLAGVVRVGWPLALALAVGPIVGFVLSRGPGLPSYTDDKGNWTETLGVVSLIVEASLAAIALAFVRPWETAAQTTRPQQRRFSAQDARG